MTLTYEACFFGNGGGGTSGGALNEMGESEDGGGSCLRLAPVVCVASGNCKKKVL